MLAQRFVSVGIALPAIFFGSARTPDGSGGTAVIAELLWCEALCLQIRSVGIDLQRAPKLGDQCASIG